MGPKRSPGPTLSPFMATTQQAGRARRPVPSPPPATATAHAPADEAMCDRARERYATDRKRMGNVPRRRRRHAAMPNLIIIGGVKGGTTSIPHYLGPHPEIHMSKPKELNFFVKELNWDLGPPGYEGRFAGRFPVRGESSPHYTNLPRYHGVAARIHDNLPDARLIYMVRDPISRILSHWRHATGAGYETRSMYWMQLQPYLERFGPEKICVIAQEELQAEREETMRRAFEFAGVDPDFTSEQFEREWERSTAKESDQYQLMEKLVKLPGFKSFDRNFDRLPERMRWMVEKVVHDPDAAEAPKPELTSEIESRLTRRFSGDAPRIQEFADRGFPRWKRY